MIVTIKELRTKRANLIGQANEVLKKAEAEARNLTAEEDQQWSALHKEADEIKVQYERFEKQEDLNREMNSSAGRAAGPQQAGQPGGEDQESRTAEAFARWVRSGMSDLTSEEQRMMQGRMENFGSRAQAAGTPSAGGYLVPETWATRIETAMAAFSGIRNTRATILRTNTGAPMNFPTSNDTSNKGELLGENSEAGKQDITFGSKALNAYNFSSKIILASIQFLQDSAPADIEGWIGDRAGERIGRIFADYSIKGDGSNEPEGLKLHTILGDTTAAATAIKWNELVELEHSVNPAYRKQAEYLLSDDALKNIKKLKDGESRPLWLPGIAVKEPDTIMGYRFHVDQEIDKVEASKIPVYFGDFSKVLIRDVIGIGMMRLVERYAEFLQVGFLAFSRHDMMILDAGTHPIKHLKMHA